MNGDLYTFYNKGNKTGSITIRNGNALTMLGNYLYYYEMTPVGSNAKNYNAVEVSQYGEIKYNYELFRYDVVKNSNKKIDCNIVVMEINSLYNYTAKIYDAEMNLINSVGWNLYVNEKLMSFNNNNKTGFTDYGGNIVIEPKYSSALMISGNSYIIFFGRVAYVMERQADGVS